MTLTRRSSDILVQIRWETNKIDEMSVTLPQRGARTDPAILKSIREMAEMHTDAETAAYLNDSGWVTAHGKPFTADLVHGLRREHQIVKVHKGGG